MIRSEIYPRRLFASFPGGGEVFAIGVPGRMPLQRMTLRMEHIGNGSDSVWMTLRHGASGQVLYMVPPTATAGSWMLRLGPRAGIPEGSSKFCVDPQHGLFAFVTRGYVNLRNQVLLRGHGDRQAKAAGKIPSSRTTILHVPMAAFRADDEYWRLVW